MRLSGCRFASALEKVAAGSLKCGWFAGVVVLVLTLLRAGVAVGQTRTPYLSIFSFEAL